MLLVTDGITGCCYFESNCCCDVAGSGCGGAGSQILLCLHLGSTGGLGFLLAIVLFASVRERVEFAEYPESFEGFPICLVTASLLALAFMGFSGMKIF